ncbi:MAG TPA: ABC-type transport auxiliary lipoprotein family protein [Rubrivivax sp.]|nr:ABC-type transport auxiliary lipoprotein family protein [Rubrivivax sp.]
MNPSERTRRQALRRLAGAVPAALLAGCGFGRAPRTDFYLLRDAQADAAAMPGATLDKVLLVASGAMPGLYDSDRMVFSADGRSRSYFQYGYWSERPAQALLRLAETRLQGSKRFREVALSTAGVRGDLLLSLRLDELYLDTSVEPAQVRLSVAAELLDWHQRRLLSRRSFAQAVPVARRDAAGLAEAASQATGAMLGELVDWAAASAAG